MCWFLKYHSSCIIYASCFCSVAISCFLRHDCFQFWNVLLFSSALGIILQARVRVIFFKKPGRIIIFTLAVTILSHRNPSLLVLPIEVSLHPKGHFTSSLHLTYSCESSTIKGSSRHIPYPSCSLLPFCCFTQLEKIGFTVPWLN